MHFQYIPYLWLLGTSFVILMFLAVSSLRYKPSAGAKAFSMCMLNFAFWTFCNALEMAGTDLTTKLFWANMQYFSYTTINVFWLYAVLQFTGNKKWTQPKRILPLFIIPAILVLLVWTDPYHGLIRRGFSLDYSGLFPVIKKSYGPLYWIHPIYGYSIVLISIIVIARAVFVHRSIYRMQALALLISPIISIVPSILYVFSLSPVKGFDITPVFFGVSGMFAAIGLFRYQLFALEPIARDIAVDNMTVGMLVVDTHETVIDANPEAVELLSLEKKDMIGVGIQTALDAIGVESEALSEGKRTVAQVQNEREKKTPYYEIQRLPVYNQKHIRAGTVFLIQDVTEIRRAQEQIVNQSMELAASKERERLSRDLHDNLGQVLGFINVQAQGIRNELSDAAVSVASEEIQELIEATQSAHEEIRNYIQHARRESETFEKSLSDLVRKFESQAHVRVTLQMGEDIPWQSIPSRSKENLLFIVKEALSNVRKHAEASHVFIEMNVREHLLSIAIQDNGKGFDSDACGEALETHFGLKIMKERAELIKARFFLNSALGKGCRIFLEMPLLKGDDDNGIESIVD
jgi:PAS domain S-box-containing protein